MGRGGRKMAIHVFTKDFVGSGRKILWVNWTKSCMGEKSAKIYRGQLANRNYQMIKNYLLP